MTKRVIEGEQSIMGTIFFIFKVNTVEKVLRDLFQSYPLKIPSKVHQGLSAPQSLGELFVNPNFVYLNTTSRGSACCLDIGFRHVLAATVGSRVEQMKTHMQCIPFQKASCFNVFEIL